jgi:hypothetical protein
MGFETLDDNDGEGFAKFREGDNAIIQLKQIKPEKDSYEGEEYRQLAMRFDAVLETDDEEVGVIPGWFNSKVTIKESDEHTSFLGNLLEKAEVVDQVLGELGADDETIEAIKAGEQRFTAEDSDENEALGKAVAKALKGVSLRAGTKHNSGSDYSIVKSVHGLADQEDGEEEKEEDESEESDSGDDVILEDDDDDEASE